MKRIFITTIFIISIIIIFIFFNKNNYKNQNNGNNIISKSPEQNILNMTYYKAQIEVTITSNKNTNKYIINQEYNKNKSTKQEIIKPDNIAGIKFNFENNKITIENTKLNLQTIYENYPYINENNLFLNDFIEEYKKNQNSKIEKKNGEIILETTTNLNNKNKLNKKLYINEKTGKPIKLEVQDSTQNTIVYILYNEIEIN